MIFSTVLFLILTNVVLFVFFYLRNRQNYFKNRNVPTIAFDPLWGHIKDFVLMRRSLADIAMEMYFHKDLKDKPYAGMFIIQKPGLMIRDINLIKQITIKDANSFSDHFGHTDLNGDSIGRYNLFFSKGNEWKAMRQRLLQAFTSGKLKLMFPLIDTVRGNMDDYLLSKKLDASNPDRCIDLKALFSRFTMDVIATTAFGVDANTIANPNAEFYQQGKYVFDFNFWRSIEFNTMFFLPQFSSLIKAKLFSKRGHDFLTRVTHEVIAERMKNNIFRNDLIDLLVEFKKKPKQDGFEFTDDMLVSQTATFFAAGYETSSSLVSFGLYELAKKPELQKRLKAEIKKTLNENGGKWNYDTVMGMEYLNMVVQEVLRLHPVLPFLDRKVTLEKGVKKYSLKPYGDYEVEHGMPIMIPVFAIQRDPEYFSNPNEFNPERFSPENKGNVKSGTHFPFGVGPRICIGERLGILNGKMGLISLLTNHHVKPNAKTYKEMEYNTKALLLAPKDGILVDVCRD